MSEAPDCKVQMRRSLRVIAVDGHRATLEAPRASACAACAVKAGCGTGVLAEMLGAKEHVVVETKHPTAVGEMLEVSMDRGHFLRTLVWVYLLPAFALMGTALGSLALGLSNLATASLLVPILALSFVPLLRAERSSQPFTQVPLADYTADAANE